MSVEELRHRRSRRVDVLDQPVPVKMQAGVHDRADRGQADRTAEIAHQIVKAGAILHHLLRQRAERDHVGRHITEHQRHAAHRLISLSVPAFRIAIGTPFSRAASFISLVIRSVFALFGFTSTAITPAWGTSSEISSSRLGISSTLIRLTPVRLPPGRARLGTRPRSTGSPTLKACGIVEVALFAASAEGSPSAAITSTIRPTKSVTNEGSRS